MKKTYCPECGEEYDGKHCFECGFPHDDGYEEFGEETLNIFQQEDEDDGLENFPVMSDEDLLYL